jgi:anti-anti-sigma factor
VAIGVEDWRTGLVISTDLGARRLTLTGELDFFSPSLTEVSATLMVVNPGDTTVDLGGVRFIDAGGLGRLVRLRNNLARHKATLTVINASTGAQRIFRIAGLQDMLPRGSPTVDAIGNGGHVASGSDQVARIRAKHS